MDLTKLEKGVLLYCDRRRVDITLYSFLIVTGGHEVSKNGLCAHH